MLLADADKLPAHQKYVMIAIAAGYQTTKQIKRFALGQGGVDVQDTAQALSELYNDGKIVMGDTLEHWRLP